jgi:uncharacterized protein YciI
MELSESARSLLAGMLNKPLFVALREPANVELMGSLLEAHLRWAVEAEARGELFASGPFTAPGAAPGVLGGMSIVRASGPDEARAILARDPFVAQGAVRIDLRQWLLMEGGLTVTVRFSDQTAQIR